MARRRSGRKHAKTKTARRAPATAKSPPRATPAAGKRLSDWEKRVLAPHLAKSPERAANFRTLSEVEPPVVATPEHLRGFSYDRKLGWPGEYPFTRGIHPNMYRGRVWTMRQFAGFGSVEETNERFKYLLAHGQTGLSVAFDFPTLHGYDSDDSRSRGEVGKTGVAVSSLRDMEDLLEGLPLDEVTTSMTINGPAAMIWAMYLAAAERHGFPMASVGGTIQNDILKEYIAQKMFIFPPKPAMRLVIDTFEFGSRNVPRWNTVSISGYHIREAGSTAVQELAFTLRNGMEYVKWGIERGLAVDDFAPRLSFFFNAHNDLFEEVAKFRAARRIWARFMREEARAKNPRSWLLRFHTQTAGCSCTAQQPEINIVRTTIQALAAVLGGTQSLHTNSFDEALALPTEKAVRIALRTQQILAHESGVANTADPLGGSYYVEWLTDEMERQAEDYFDRIEAQGGVIPAIEKGWFQREIAAASYRYQKEVEAGTRVVVGVNKHTETEEKDALPILKVSDESEVRQRARLLELRRTRDARRVDESLERLTRACEKEGNLVPPILEAVRAYATLGEIRAAMVKVFGEYEEPAMF
ncbi:MAG TPA: methylmalonyl-CoA mutase family protein [Candidatus Thermoplasmatota archaeon]|nr:methylmalonyl-CoA mutase family protein [Candidatus Thermoplasmatota archaeon]